MAMVPMRRNPLTSMLNFAADRDREASSLGDVISQIVKPVLSGMGVQTDEMTPQPAVMRGPVPTAQPLGPMTGPAMAPTPVMSKEELKANVFPGESGGDYNALFGYSNRPGGKFEGVKLTDMTVNEVAEFTDPKGPYGQWVKDQIGYVATPTGAFQTVGTTLKDAMRGLGLTGDEPYDQNTQDAIGMWIYENQGPEAWEGWNKGTMTAGGGDTRLDGGAGADTLGTGFNVEDILAQLYPQMSPEDERKQNRKDFFAAASQGLSALSQGRPQDFSNIRQAKEQRRTQAVNDMRERERARAAGNLVFSQTGDRDLTSAVVTGAISYNDVVSERERKRVEAEADRVRLQQEQANDRLTGIVESMWPELGLPDSVKEEVLAGIAAGDDPNTIFTLNEQAKVAEAARKVEEQEAEDAETRAAAIDAFSTQGGPVEQYAARLLTFDPKLTIDQALERSTKLMRPEADGQAGTAIGYADALVAAGAINQATGQPYTRAEALAATILPQQAGDGGPLVTMGADGTITIRPQAVAQTAGGAPVTSIAPVTDGTAVTGVTPAPVDGTQELPLDVATQVTELEQKRLELQQARDEAPDDAARRALDLQIGDVNLQTAQLQLKEAQAATGLDQQEQELRIATAQANLDKAEREIADAEEGEKAASAKKELRLTATTEAGTRQISKLLGMAADWNPGVAGGLERFIAGYLPGSDIYDANSLVDSLNANSIITTIGVMKESSPTGATGFGATTLPEISAMQDQLGKLDPLVKPELFVEQLQSLNNFILDSAYGTQSQIAKNPNLTDAEKEFYSQRFDLRTGEIVSLGLVPLDEGVVTMWQQGDIAPNLVVTPDDMTPEERAIFDSLN